MKCFYHLDDDGKCAAYLISRYAYDLDQYDDEYIRINYDIPFPFDIIGKDEYVYILDYSINPDEMTKLREITNNIIWIDHHYTAILKHKGINDDIPGIRYSNDEFQLSGAALTFYWCTRWNSGVDAQLREKDVIELDLADAKEFWDDIPKWIQYISAYDTWSHHLLPNVVEFHAGMEMIEGKEDFDNNYRTTWKQIDDIFEDRFEDEQIDWIDSVINNGKAALKFRDEWAKNYVDNFSYEVEFEGYRCCVLQLQTCGSQWFKSQENKGYDIFIACAYNGHEWITSLYSTTVDVGQIALKYGGGGHKGAAGFHTKEFLFNK